MHRKRTLPLLILLLSFLAACGLLGEGTNSGDTTATAPLPTAADTPTPASIPATLEAATPPPSIPPLTIWILPEISPRNTAAAGSLLQQQLDTFNTTHPDLSLRVEAKTAADQGGSLNYLRTGRSVAPDILPDVVLLPTNQLRAAADEDLIFPLDDLLEAEMVEDLYPVADTLGRVDGILYGYPFALMNMQHIAYNSTAITGTLPTSWPGLLEAEVGSMVFPAAGPAGAELVLQFYLAAGGILTTDGGQHILEIDPLTTALTQINQGVLDGFIQPESATATSPEQAWQATQNTPALLVQTTASQYLQQQAQGNTVDFTPAPIPGLAGPLPPLLEGWTWAVSTPDPGQQVLAAELISWLAAGQNLGDWSRDSQLIPARPSAFASWPADDPYVSFLQQQVTAAQRYPAGANSAILTALSNAATDVISQLSTPAAAAAEAAAAIQP